MGEYKPSKQIIAHRGFWLNASDANSKDALQQALEYGFGIETDLRARCGQVVVSHDLPTRNSPIFSDLVNNWTRLGILDNQTIALNIKEDGLIPLLIGNMEIEKLIKSFFFDMSVPEMLAYLKFGLPVASRLSEFEVLSNNLTDKMGATRNYWLDSFYSDWWLDNEAVDELCATSEVTLVSPEIHGRNPDQAWDWFAEKVSTGCRINLCTDLPLRVLRRIT